MIFKKYSAIIQLLSLLASTMNKKLLEILVSPISKTSLVYKKELNELWAPADRLAFPIREGIPIMLVEEARPLTEQEWNQGKVS